MSEEEGVRFCGDGCREAYLEDRKLRLIYGPWKFKDGTIVGHDDACERLGICRYCLSPLKLKGAAR